MSGNLRLIKTQTMTDDVQSVSVTNVFSSEYDVYLIKGSNFIGKNSTATGLNLRLINSSDSVITSGYTYGQHALKGNTSFSKGFSTTSTFIDNVFGSLDDGGQSSGSIAYIFNPFNTRYTMVLSQNSSIPSGDFRMHKGVAVYPQTTSITGIQAHLNESVSRFSGVGKISVYGVK